MQLTSIDRYTISRNIDAIEALYSSLLQPAHQAA